jgi:inner membrane protein
MDSLTQIVLGAAVGEALAGRKLGNKALLAGAVAGTIPDLDVVLRPFQDLVGYLSFHRSLTHSLLFALLAPWLFAWLSKRLLPRWPLSGAQWAWLYFWGFLTHALLDCFTTWGTQLFFPFSHYGVAFYSVFVIDPAYTLPFMGCLLLAARLHREHPWRARWNWLGIAASSAYLAWTVVAQQLANRTFEAAWAKQGIHYQGYITKPTPFNSLFWSTTAQNEEGFYSGFHSLLARGDSVRFRFIPQRKELLAPYLPHPELERLLEITKGYYAVEPAEKGVLINDLRFGEFNGWEPQGGEFVFAYHVWEEGGQLRFEQREYKMDRGGDYLRAFWGKIVGE